MKKLLILLALLPFFASAECGHDHVKGNGVIKTEKRETSGFKKISTAGSIDVIIVQGSSEGTEVTTDENLLQYVVTTVKNNTLSIALKEDVSVSTEKLIVKVFCRELTSISSGGSGDITVDSELKADKLQISQGGSGDYVLNLNVHELEISKAGSGDFDIKGKVQKLEISSAGSGDVKADDSVIGDAAISMAGSGDVFLPRGLKAKISSVGSGEVRYE